MQNQYSSWLQAYEAIHKLGLVKDLSTTINFPVNSNNPDYTVASHTVQDIQNRAFDELYRARLSREELTDLEKATNQNGLRTGITSSTLKKLKTITVLTS